MGINPESAEPLRKAAKSQLHKQLVEAKIAELKSKIGKGGLRTCLVRGALYVGMSREARSTNEPSSLFDEFVLLPTISLA